MREAGGEIRGFPKRVRENCERVVWVIFDKIVEEFGGFSHEAPISLGSKIFHKSLCKKVTNPGTTPEPKGVISEEIGENLTILC